MSENSNQPTPAPVWRRVLDAATSLSIVAVCLTMTWSILRGGSIVIPPVARNIEPVVRTAPDTRREAPLPAETVSLENAAVRGAPSATVAIIEYSDFQCPYCAAFVRRTLPMIEKEYIAPGKIVMAFRHLPLESLHPFAVKAAEAAECAARQNKFWAMHDALFRNPQQLDESTIRGHGASIGLNLAAFDTCVAGQASGVVREDVRSAGKLGIRGTPTFLLGTLQADRRVRVTARLSGAAPFERFQEEIEKLLPAAQATSRQ